MRKSIKQRITDNRGSALVSVFLVIMVLLVLGMGILALTMNNVKQSAVVDNYERDYYAANRAAQQAIENLKRTVGDYYNDLALKFADTANIAAYETAYNNFFTNVRNNANATFTEPALDTSRGGPGSTVTTVAMGTPNGNTCTYTISSKAVAGETTRTVYASITIIRTEKFKTEFLTKFGNNALIAGGNVNMDGNKNAKIDVNGDVVVGGSVVDTTHGGSGYFDATNYDPAHPELYVDPTIVSKLTWSLSYGSFPQVAKDAAVAAAAPKISNGATVQASSYITPMDIEGNPGASYMITGASPATSGQIGSTGNLTLDGATLSGVSIYVSGNLTIKNSTSLSGVSIYVTGASSVLDIDDSTLTNVKIYCNGDMNSYNTVYRHNSSGQGCQVAVRGDTTLSGDSLDSQQSKCYFYTGGTFTILSSHFDNIIVYAGTKLNVLLESHGNRKGNRSELTGLLYTAGSAEINSCLIRGQLVSKNDVLADDSINSSTLADLVFAPADISDLLNDPTFTSSIFANETLGSVTKIYIKPLISEMYSGESGIKES